MNFNDMEFIEEDGYYVLEKYVGTAESVVVPAILDGKRVLKIGVKAFEDCRSLREVIIENGVEEIEIGAFYGNHRLKEVTIPESVKIIDGNPFAFCKDVQFTVDPENNCFTVAGGALFSIDLKRLIKYNPHNMREECFLPDELEICNEFSFDGAKFNAVHIGKNMRGCDVEEFGPFACCYGIKHITVDGENEYFEVKGTQLLDKKNGEIWYDIEEKSFIPEAKPEEAPSVHRDPVTGKVDWKRFRADMKQVPLPLRIFLYSILTVFAAIPIAVISIAIAAIVQAVS